MVRLQSMMFFTLWVLPAILPVVATQRAGTSHETINMAPDRMLAGDLLGVNLSITVSYHPLGSRYFPLLSVLDGRGSLSSMW